MRLAVLLLLGATLGCDDARFPRDPNGTLDSVLATDQMVVAAVDHPPWVVVGGEGGSQGAEVELVEALAHELGVSIEWRRMPALEALEGLERGEVQLAIGGFERKSVTPVAGAAPSYAYFREAIVVGARPGTATPEDLEARRVYVPPEEPATELVRNHGGIPVAEWSDDVALAAVPHWQLEALGLVPSGIVLQRRDHVVAVPQGENAWLMRIERFLRSETGDIGARLRAHQP
jgi:polar amino acid transport system substrate-binding protein